MSGNTLDNISYDGMVFGHVQNARIEGNDVTMHGRENVDHKDVIQFYNQGSKAPSANVVIANNTLTAEDSNIHGIYMGNNDANRSGGSREYYSNITITGNVIDVQHTLGVAVGQTDGLEITGNVVLQNANAGSARAINTPRILVDHDSHDVRVTGNTVLDTPSAAVSNWQKGDGSGGGWTISNNEVVSVATSVSQYLTGSKSGSGSDSGSGVATSTTSGAGETGTGAADVFRFTGDHVAGATGTTLDGVDFGAGDTLKLGRYDAGTFEDQRDGNVVHNNDSGTYVKIDSLTDIAELAAHSDAVSAHVSGDDLTVTITQDSGALDLVLAGLGQDYQASYDETLF